LEKRCPGVSRSVNQTEIAYPRLNPKRRKKGGVRGRRTEQDIPCLLRFHINLAMVLCKPASMIQKCANEPVNVLRLRDIVNIDINNIAEAHAKGGSILATSFAIGT
jgi:hypothetical protein